MITFNINMNENQLKSLFIDTDSLMCEIKTEGVYEDFNIDKEMFDFSHYSTKSKWKMKDKTGAVAIEEFVGLKCIHC